MKITVEQLIKWCHSATRPWQSVVSGAAIDSRKVQAGDAFFAFKGERVNGEDYVDQALAAGAALCVVSTDYQGNLDRVVVVKDVLEALQAIAKAYRQTLAVNIVAITGSVGKTTTRRLTEAVVKTKYRTYASSENYNNEIGLSLSILEITPEHEWAILEMGMDRYGDIALLSKIAQQSVAIITNIGTAHIEFFGTRQKIAEAKLEVVTALSAGDSLILNSDDDILAAYQNDQFKIIYTGNHKLATIKATNISLTPQGTAFTLNADGSQQAVQMQLFGNHNVQNALLAAALGVQLGIDLATVASGLASCVAETMRFERVRVGAVNFINDAYNASYDSIIASAKTFAQLSYRRHILILGDIFECGDQQKAIHSKVGRDLNIYQFDYICFIGQAMQDAFNSYNGPAKHFLDVADCVAQLSNLLNAEDGVLIKASRGMALENIIVQYRRSICSGLH